jgi:hypothetical protein
MRSTNARHLPHHRLRWRQGNSALARARIQIPTEIRVSKWRYRNRRAVLGGSRSNRRIGLSRRRRGYCHLHHHCWCQSRDRRSEALWSGLVLDYEKTPHACFKVESTSIAMAGKDFPQALANQLQPRFASVQMVKTPFKTSWSLVLQLERQSYMAVLGPSKYGNDEWLLLVGPPDAPRLLDQIRGDESAVSQEELIRICREVHAVLTTSRGISAVRWYFEGLHTQTAAVATPDELPWVKHKL